MDMKFGLWNVRSLYRMGSIMTDLVGVQVVRWEGGGTEPAREYTFFLWKVE
jgi:hypothetical protein